MPSIKVFFKAFKNPGSLKDQTPVAQRPDPLDFEMTIEIHHATNQQEGQRKMVAKPATRNTTMATGQRHLPRENSVGL